MKPSELHKLEIKAKFRHVDGTRKRFINTGRIGTANHLKINKKIRIYNSKSTNLKARRITITGEKGDTRTYWAIKIEDI